MSDRETVLLSAAAVIVSSAVLILLLFAFAVFRDALWGAVFALAAALGVYVFQLVQFSEQVSALQSVRRYEPSGLVALLFLAPFVVGTASAFLSIAGV